MKVYCVFHITDYGDWVDGEDCILVKILSSRKSAERYIERYKEEQSGQGLWDTYHSMEIIPWNVEQ